MKHTLAPLLLCLTLSPVLAEDVAPSPDVEEGFNLMEEGAKLLLRGLASQMEPALSDMQKSLTELQPAVKQLLDMMGDIRNYHAPELQPNGDILIRRKSPAEITQDGAEIEL